MLNAAYLGVRPVMFQVHVEHDRFLYHYTSIETALNHILADQTIQIGSFRGTNDPKESKNWEFSVAMGNMEASYEETTEARNAIAALIKDKAKVLCFSQDKNYCDIEPLNHIYSRGFAKPRMWAQYGGNHTGVCLVFDWAIIAKAMTEQFSGNTTDVYWGAVRYVNRQLGEDVLRSGYTINYPQLKNLGREVYVRRHVFSHHERLFFEKAADWRDEDEYRWVLISDRPGNLYVNFGPALAGVVFGQYTEESDISAVVKAARQIGEIKFEQMSWKNCTPWLSFRLVWA